MAAKDDYLIDQLVDLGYVTNEQLEPLRTEAAASGAGIVDLLLERKILTSLEIGMAKAAHFGAEFVKLSDLRLAASQLDHDAEQVLWREHECVTRKNKPGSGDCQ